MHSYLCRTFVRNSAWNVFSIRRWYSRIENKKKHRSGNWKNSHANANNIMKINYIVSKHSSLSLAAYTFAQRFHHLILMEAPKLCLRSIFVLFPFFSSSPSFSLARSHQGSYRPLSKSSIPLLFSSSQIFFSPVFLDLVVLWHLVIVFCFRSFYSNRRTAASRTCIFGKKWK